MHRGLVLLLLSGVSFHASAQGDGRPPLRLVAQPDERIERLPRGYAQLEPRASSVPNKLAQARRLLATAARTGDARLAARADALLQSFPVKQASPDLLMLRAFSAQHRHDFAGALRLLDELVALQPRDGEARLSRAQVLMVQGRLDLARADCAALALGVDSGRGQLCAAALSLRRGNYTASAMLSERWLEQAAPDDPSRSFALLIRAESASRAGAADADAWFARGLALGPDDVRTLAAVSRHYRASGRPALALRLLHNAPPSDGIALQQTLAAVAARAPSASALVEAQARRYALAHALGAEPEQRDEAEFLLVAKEQPRAALALARLNFAQQRDHEDVAILVRSALAAGQPEALAPLRTWAQQHGVPLPAEAAGGS